MNPSLRLRALTVPLMPLTFAVLACAAQAAPQDPPPPPDLKSLPPLVRVQPAAPAASAPFVAQAPAPAASVPAASAKKVLEDDRVRIEETRVRGQVQHVVVQSKLPGVKAYEVIMPPLGKDPSQDKGAAGKRTWSIFDF